MVGKALSAVTAERIFESTAIYLATRTNNPGNPGVARDLKMERMSLVKAFSNRFKSGSDTQLGKVCQLLKLFGEKPILWD